MDRLTDAEILNYNKKHKWIRGSSELKYPPKESRCHEDCGERHCEILTATGRKWTTHPCFLAIGHSGKCEFSSECDALFASTSTAVAHVAA
jgi:hypothetical protein